MAPLPPPPPGITASRFTGPAELRECWLGSQSTPRLAPRSHRPPRACPRRTSARCSRSHAARRRRARIRPVWRAGRLRARPAGSSEASLGAISGPSHVSGCPELQPASANPTHWPALMLARPHQACFQHRCPGGYDDDEYVRCSYRAQSAARPPWSETGHEAYTKPPRKSSGGKSTAGGTSAAGGTPADGATSASGGAGSAAAPAVDAKRCIVVD